MYGDLHVFDLVIYITFGRGNFQENSTDWMDEDIFTIAIH